MKLHHFPLSPNSRKVLAVAQFIGISLELNVVDLAKGEQMQPDFLKLNPNHMVPVLEDGDFVLWESNAIMEYLASKEPNSLWPYEVRARVDISRWMYWQSAHWGRALAILNYERVVKPLQGEESDPDEIKKGEKMFARFAKVLNQHLKGRVFLVGKGLTLADFAVAAPLSFWRKAKIPIEKYPHLKAWYDHMEMLDAWKKTSSPFPS